MEQSTRAIPHQVVVGPKMVKYSGPDLNQPSEPKFFSGEDAYDAEVKLMKQFYCKENFYRTLVIC